MSADELRRWPGATMRRWLALLLTMTLFHGALVALSGLPKLDTVRYLVIVTPGLWLGLACVAVLVRRLRRHVGQPLTVKILSGTLIVGCFGGVLLLRNVSVPLREALSETTVVFSGFSCVAVALVWRSPGHN